MSAIKQLDNKAFGGRLAIGVFQLLSLQTYMPHRLASSAHTQERFCQTDAVQLHKDTASSEHFLAYQPAVMVVSHYHDCRLISQNMSESAQQNIFFQPAPQPSLSIEDGLPGRASSHSRTKLGFKHQPWARAEPRTLAWNAELNS